MARILAFSGSSRKDSTNQKTVDALSDALSEAGAEVTRISLKDYAAPIYDGDLEAELGLPEGVRAFKALLQAHDGLLIGSPEYNGYMTPLLLNTIDWATRSEEATPDLSGFRDKSLLVVSSSPGGLAGIRSATQLKNMLTSIGCLLCPDSFGVPAGFKAFGEDGKLLDEKQLERAAQIGARFYDFTTKTR